jgi:hypothetical protein
VSTGRELLFWYFKWVDLYTDTIGLLKYPDFLIIGAQKAGTTWLHRNLQAHPQIWMPKEKELHYFDEKIRVKPSLLTKLRGDEPPEKRWRRQVVRQLKGYRKDLSSKEKISLKDLKKDLQWDFRYFLKKPGNEWYASLFEQGEGKITGEATPDYSIIRQPRVAQVHEVMPDAKIVLMVRNPLERAWSQALMDFERRRPLDSVTDQLFRRHFLGHRPRMFSDYQRTLENWGSYYPDDQIFVGFLEDVSLAPNRLLERLYGFLGAESTVKYRVIKRKIHSRSVETIPTRHAKVLARIYHDELVQLSERFGGYASFWLYCADRLINDTPEEESIPYPLWESRFWEEWGDAQKVAVQSGALSSMSRGGSRGGT